MKLLLVVLALFVIVAPLSAQESELPASLTEQMDQLEAIAITLRDLPSLRPIARDFPTREETIAYLERSFADQLPPDRLADVQAFYVALGMIPPQTDLQTLFLELFGSQVAGFYDTETQVMNVIPVIGSSPGARLSFTEQIIFVHEYVHALQDQHFGLDQFIGDGDSLEAADRTLAVLSLIEGDATLVMNTFAVEATQRNPMLALSLILEGAAAGNLTLPPGLPEGLVRELLFPYEAGERFIRALVQSDGWDAVNAAFSDNPPATIKHILDPDTYRAGFQPDVVTLFQTNELGEGIIEMTPDVVLGESWREVYDTTIGIFYLRELLINNGVARRDAERVTLPWSGDRFHLFTRGEGEIAFVLGIGMETPEDKIAFRDALGVGCRPTPAGILCVSEDGGVVTLAPDTDTAGLLGGFGEFMG